MENEMKLGHGALHFPGLAFWGLASKTLGSGTFGLSTVHFAAHSARARGSGA